MLNKIFCLLVDFQVTVRTFFWKLLLKKTGKNVRIREGVIIMSPQKVEIGDNSSLNVGVKVGGQCGVKIGKDVLIGYNVNIVSENHEYRYPNIPIRKQGFFGAPIVIEDNVWIGANAVILPGVKVGKGVVIGANVVVTRNVAPYTIVGGIPVKYVIYRRDL